METEPDNLEWNKCKITPIKQNVSNSKTDGRKYFGTNSLYHSSSSLHNFVPRSFPLNLLGNEYTHYKKRDVNRIVTSRIILQTAGGGGTKDGHKKI
jgi:hypothetical protein